MNSDISMTASSASGSSAGAFFAIYDCRQYPAYDNAAFAHELPPNPAAAEQLRRPATDGRAARPARHLHLPTNGAAPAEQTKGKSKMKATAAAAPFLDDSLDDNSVLDGPGCDTPTEAPAVSSCQADNRWAAAAAAVVEHRKRPTLLKLAEAATAAADLSEMLSREIQRQRVESSLLGPQRQQQQQQQQSAFTRTSGGSVRHHPDWWRGAIAEHLNSRAGHHYFNGERDPSATARTSIRGSLLAYRRGPRPEVIGHFDQPPQQKQQQQLQQQQQQKLSFRRKERFRQSTRH